MESTDRGLKLMKLGGAKNKYFLKLFRILVPVMEQLNNTLSINPSLK